MELALNFVWILLALPAAWVYRRQAISSAHAPVLFARTGSVVILGCILVLLFPVVSATDDLHTIGFEMEEPGVQRWTKSQAGDRTSSVFKSGPMLAQAFFLGCRRNDQVLGRVWIAPVTLAEESAVLKLATRAPPLPHLG